MLGIGGELDFIHMICFLPYQIFIKKNNKIILKVRKWQMTKCLWQCSSVNLLDYCTEMSLGLSPPLLPPPSHTTSSAEKKNVTRRKRKKKKKKTCSIFGKNRKNGANILKYCLRTKDSCQICQYNSFPSFSLPQHLSIIVTNRVNNFFRKEKN